jgi:hypothetical protein
MASRAELQRSLAAAFEAQGWPYEHAFAPALFEHMEKLGASDGATLAQHVSADFLDRHHITREHMGRVLDKAIGGQTLERDAPSETTLVFTDNRYSIQIGDHSQVSNSTLNTGNQIIVQASASKDDLLEAVSALVRGGLSDDWNDDAAQQLAQVIDGRDDIMIEDVRDAARAAAEAEQAEPGKVKALLTRISVGATSGALGTGIVAALGALF